MTCCRSSSGATSRPTRRSRSSKAILKDMTKDQARSGFGPGSLYTKLDLVGRLIEQGFGTRVFYVAIDGFDTHSDQAQRTRACCSRSTRPSAPLPAAAADRRRRADAADDVLGVRPAR